MKRKKETFSRGVKMSPAPGIFFPLPPGSKRKNNFRMRRRALIHKFVRTLLALICLNSIVESSRVWATARAQGRRYRPFIAVTCKWTNLVWRAIFFLFVYVNLGYEYLRVISDFLMKLKLLFLFLLFLPLPYLFLTWINQLSKHSVLLLLLLLPRSWWVLFIFSLLWDWTKEGAQLAIVSHWRWETR